jgi:hypothetical protein
MTKVCSKCGIEKDIELFYKRKEYKSGYRNDCIACVRKHQDEYYKKYYAIKENREKNQKQHRIHHYEEKDLVFNHYGGYKCACCGIEEKAFLSIDHINGGGNKHRRSIGIKSGSGVHLYHWLVVNEFPEGFRVLCMNCQFGYRILGLCPHQKKEEKNEIN